MLITKLQAQEILGGSQRKIERLVKSGKLPVAHYEKGARKPTPFFDRDAVEALKEEPAPIQSDAQEESANATKRQSDAKPTHAMVKAPLPFRLNQAQDTPELTVRLVEVLETLAAQNAKAQSAKAQSAKATLALSDLSAKLLLTLPESSAITGLSRAVIRAAIEADQLKAKQIGRAWRVKRADLDQWIESL